MQRIERRAYWSQQVETWKTSGVSRRAFCLHNGFVHKTFLYWERGLAAASEDRGPLCVEVGRAAAPAEGVVADVQGIRVPVGDGEVTIHGRIGVGRLLRIVQACGAYDVSAEA